MQLSEIHSYPLKSAKGRSHTTAGLCGRGLARFRPNLVVSGAPPWAEDDWRVIRIGQVRFKVASACTRCVFTTVDPARGERDADGEPLGILGRLRQRPEWVVFGANLLPMGGFENPSSSLGRLNQGDLIERLE